VSDLNNYNVVFFQILEISTVEDKVERFDTGDRVKMVLKEMQYYALIRQQITKSRNSIDGVMVSMLASSAGFWDQAQIWSN
jgi:hypothetical protein